MKPWKYCSKHVFLCIELETGNDQINGCFGKKLQYKVLLVLMSAELFLLGSWVPRIWLCICQLVLPRLLLSPYRWLFKQDSAGIISLRERMAPKFHMGWFPRPREREVMLLNYILCIRKFDCICETVSYVMNSNSTLLQCPKGDVKSMYNMQEATYNSFNYNKGNTYNITFITMWFD